MATADGFQGGFQLADTPHVAVDACHLQVFQQVGHRLVAAVVYLPGQLHVTGIGTAGEFARQLRAQGGVFLGQTGTQALDVCGRQVVHRGLLAGTMAKPPPAHGL
jgi:hypothetical protein